MPPNISLSPPVEARPSTGKLVYLMDDMPILSRMYCEVLERAGYQTEIGLSADEAYTRLNATGKRPDLVILDVNVPGSMTGIELCHRLRSEAQFKRLPIVMLTANTQTEQEAWNAGCDAFFAKPCKLEALVEVVDALTSVPA